MFLSEQKVFDLAGQDKGHTYIYGDIPPAHTSIHMCTKPSKCLMINANFFIPLYSHVAADWGGKHITFLSEQKVQGKVALV